MRCRPRPSHHRGPRLENEPTPLQWFAPPITPKIDSYLLSHPQLHRYELQSYRARQPRLNLAHISRLAGARCLILPPWPRPCQFNEGGIAMTEMVWGGGGTSSWL